MSRVACCLYEQERAGLQRIVNYLLKNFDVGTNKERVTCHVKNAITRELAKGTIKNISNNGWKSTFEVNNVVNVNVIGKHNVVNVRAQPKKIK